MFDQVKAYITVFTSLGRFRFCFCILKIANLNLDSAIDAYAQVEESPEIQSNLIIIKTNTKQICEGILPTEPLTAQNLILI